MKLKLEAQQNIAILSAFESIVIQDVLVLKAGLNKLFQSGKKQVVLDLTGIPPESIGDEATRELAQLPGWAMGSEAQVCIASQVQSVGQASDRQSAIQLLGSNLGKLLAVESKLTAQLKNLQIKKDSLQQQLASPQSPESDIRALKQQASELKALSQSMEEQIKLLLKNRKNPLASPGEAKRKVLVDTVDSLLQHQGVLPPK